MDPLPSGTSVHYNGENLEITGTEYSGGDQETGSNVFRFRLNPLKKCTVTAQENKKHREITHHLLLPCPETLTQINKGHDPVCG